MEAIKWIHIACVLLSGAGFFVRGILVARDSVFMSARPVKVLPHIVDTLLLFSGIVLASQWGWAVFQLPWLLAKVVLLLVYIGLGTLALRTREIQPLSMFVRKMAWLAALGVYVYIAMIAMTKNPLLMW